MLKAKAKAKARKRTKKMPSQDLLPLRKRKRNEEDPRPRRTREEEDPLHLLRTGLQLLPRGEEHPPLVIRISLLASDGLKALALTRIVGIGIPRPVVTSRQEPA